MKKIVKFQEFVNEEAGALKAAGAKLRRTVTGESAGEEIPKLPQAQQDKLFDMYKKDPNEAAKYLRSIIVKEKNSQFGLGLALTVAGAGMVYKAANMSPEPNPQPPKHQPEPSPTDTGGSPKPGAEDYTVQRGDSWSRIAQEHLPKGSSQKEIMAYAKQLAADNNAQNLYSGKMGSPGLKADTWSAMKGGGEVSKQAISAADKLTTGEVIKITPFK